MSFRKDPKIMAYIEDLLEQKKEMSFGSTGKVYSKEEILKEITRCTTLGRNMYTCFADFYKQNNKY